MQPFKTLGRERRIYDGLASYRLSLANLKQVAHRKKKS